MLILALDTATTVATCALVRDGEVLGERVSRAATVLADAAALYTPAMLTVLEEDFRRLPEILGRFLVEPPEPDELEPALVASAEPTVQLGLF